MKTTSSFILTIFFSTFFITSTNAQNEYREYNIRDTVKDENFTIFNMNDFRDALVQLGINVYKWDLPIPQDKDYKIKFYVQEYKEGKLIRDSVLTSWSTKFWGKNEMNRMEYQYIKNLRLITEMPEGDDVSFKMKISMNNNLFQMSSRFKDNPVLRPYFLIQFGEVEYETGKDIPLFLYTSGWKTMRVGEPSRQFCGVNFPTDVNNEIIKKSVHYFIFGYRVVDEEFYGRD
jgi:hypothetical protein